ncbi:MAG: S-layer homology domain-containing protein [Oscillospiraceae bacterium]|nr:S-layer homology domain-containing protein [Oscillospiraceae bacterium]
MRNLKKVLSLVLALAMVLSICMVGAGAVNYDDFGDKDKITKKEAVETLVNLNVLDGYNGGAEFRPADNVKRSEMAAMICRILAGGDNMIVDATKPVPTYADIDGHWAESYIEYCTSLGIVSGKGNGVFDPDANVTAAEASKMVMTALGYNADIEQFKGIGWDINTMAKANTLKLLENLQGEISASVPATREQVAQLVYNALTVPMVQNYVGNSANLWIGSGANAYQQTLLEKAFEAKKVTGVVIANEWASLYDNKPLAEGKTQLMLLDNEGKIAYNGDWSKYISTKEFEEDLLTVNTSTTLEQVGSSVTVMYRSGTRQEVFGLVMDSGLNKVVEFTKGGKIETPDLKFGEKQDTMYFVNYGDNSYYNGYTADLKFTYDYFTATNDKNADELLTQKEVTDAKAVYKFSRTIRVGEEVTSHDLDVIRAAYNELEAASNNKLTLTYGKTNNAVNDEYTWTRFVNTFLSDNGVVFDVTKERTKLENGNYAKLVDCDGDGIAEFYFEIDYWMDEIATAREKDGVYTYTFFSDDEVIDTSKDGNVSRIETSDDLAKGDIVVYTIIDGIAYVDLAGVVTGKVKTVSYRNKTITTTDGDEYGQSGIYNVTGYSENITDASDDLEYNFYFDKYGYIRIYKEVEGQTAYGLLTEAYLTNENNSKYVRNYVPHTELTAGAEKTREYVVSNWSDRNGNIFFDHGDVSKVDPSTVVGRELLVEAEAHLGLRAGDSFAPPATTNVAKFVLDEEKGEVKLSTAAKFATNRAGEQLYYVEGDHDIDGDGKYDIRVTEKDYKDYLKTHSAPAFNTLDPVYAIDYVELDPAQDITKGDRTYEAADGLGDNEYVNGVHDTEYYLVSDRITYITDYANLPAIKADKIKAMYAVAENTTADSNKKDYWVAKVVVIEMEGKWEEDHDSISLAYYNPFKTSQDVKYLETLNNKETDPKVTLLPKNVKDWNGQWNDNGFYKLYTTAAANDGMTADSIEKIEKDYYNTYGIYAGTVTREAEIVDRGEYIMVSRDDGKDGKPAVESVNVKDVPVYSISVDDAVVRETSDIGTGSQIIWVMNGNRTAFVVIVNYEGRGWAANKNAKWLTDEWKTIMNEQNKPASAGVEFFGVVDGSAEDNAPAKNAITVTYTEAEAFGEGQALVLGNKDASYTLKRASDNANIKLEDVKVSRTGETYTLYVSAGSSIEEWTLVQSAGRHNEVLEFNNNGTWEVVPTNRSFVYDGVHKSIKDFKELFRAIVNDGSKLTWEFRYMDGSLVGDESITTGNNMRGMATVTCEDGFQKTYTIYFDQSQVITPAQAIQKITDKYPDLGNGYRLNLYFNGTNFYLSEAEALADKADAGNPSWTSAERAAIELAQAEIDGTGYEVWKTSYVRYSKNPDGSGIGETADYGFTTTLGTNGTTKDVGYQLYIKNTQTMEEWDSTTSLAAPEMRVHIYQVDREAQNTAAAAQRAIDALNDVNVYYSEWHAGNRDASGNLTTGYDSTKSGAAEYVNYDDAETITKPDGVTSFGRSGGTSEDIGELAMVAKINAALKAAGVDASIKGTAHEAYTTHNVSSWGTDSGDVWGDPSKDKSDSIVYAAVYELFNGATNLGVTVTITYTVKAVIVSWEGNMSYPQYIPTWVLNP